MTQSRLLSIDAIVNLVLAFLLIFFPNDIVNGLGIPVPASAFYVNILGAVLLGIGLALLIERFQPLQMRGLGLDGAIVINISGAGALVMWLIFGDLEIPTRGYLLLGGLAALILGLSVFEWVARGKQPRK